jgi:hypothetical protein
MSVTAIVLLVCALVMFIAAAVVIIVTVRYFRNRFTPGGMKNAEFINPMDVEKSKQPSKNKYIVQPSGSMEKIPIDDVPESTA